MLVLVLAGRAYAAVAVQVWPHAVDAFAGTRGIGEQLARLAMFRREPQRALALLDSCSTSGAAGPAVPAPTAGSAAAVAVEPAVEPAAELDEGLIKRPSQEQPTWRYVEDPLSLLAHAVATNGANAGPPAAARTMCGRRVSPARSSKARRDAEETPLQPMAALDPQPWPTCSSCQRAMPAGARDLENARHAQWEADQLAHTVDLLEAEDEALLVAGELWEVGDVVTFRPPASADKTVQGAAGRVEVLEVLGEDERFLYGSQYAVRHLRSSRIAYATDDELLDVLADSSAEPGAAALSQTPSAAGGC